MRPRTIVIATVAVLVRAVAGMTLAARDHLPYSSLCGTLGAKHEINAEAAALIVDDLTSGRRSGSPGRTSSPAP